MAGGAPHPPRLVRGLPVQPRDRRAPGGRARIVSAARPGKFKVGDIVVLPAMSADPENGLDEDIPEQRAEILEFEEDNEMVMLCVLLEDRLEDDADGLCEIPLDELNELKLAE